MSWRAQAKGKKIFVGLSGGVDSAVAAALLKEAGAQVTGVFIKGWYPPGMPCTWAAERRDAMRVAAHLGIPFRTLDASAEYKRGVIDYLLAEYRAGRTPNPDVMCNREVKFGAFWRYAKGQAAAHIATGHYTSGEKDQRYFLWAVPRAAFAETLFPLAGLEKPAVRVLARKYGLPVASKRESQGICFLGPISVEDFLRAELGTTPGPAFDEAGTQVGTHEGAALYTLGERVPLAGGPWYLARKDMHTNTLTVARASTRHEAGEAIRLSHTNWLAEPASHDTVRAQYRYRGPLVMGRIEHDSFVPAEPLAERPAPGQSLVLYREGALLGGGIIEG